MNSTRLSFTHELNQSKSDLTILAPENIKAASRRESINGKLMSSHPALDELKKSENLLGASLLTLATVLEKYQAELSAFSPAGFHLQDSIDLYRETGRVNQQLGASLPRTLTSNTIDHLHALFTSTQFAALANRYRKASHDYNTLRTVVARFIASKTYKEKNGETRVALDQSELNALQQNMIMPIQRAPRYLMLIDQVIKQTRGAELPATTVLQLHGLKAGLERLTQHINQFAHSDMSDELFTGLVHDELNTPPSSLAVQGLAEVHEKAQFLFQHVTQLHQLGLTTEANDLEPMIEKLQSGASATEFNRMANRIHEISLRYHASFIDLIAREILAREEKKKQPAYKRMQTAYDRQLEDKKLGVLQHFKYFAERHQTVEGREMLSAWVQEYKNTFGENPLHVLKQQRRKGLIGLFNPAEPHFFALFASHYSGSAFSRLLQAEGDTQGKKVIGKIYQSHTNN